MTAFALFGSLWNFLELQLVFLFLTYYLKASTNKRLGNGKLDVQEIKKISWERSWLEKILRTSRDMQWIIPFHFTFLGQKCLTHLLIIYGNSVPMMGPTSMPCWSHPLCYIAGRIQRLWLSKTNFIGCQRLFADVMDNTEALISFSVFTSLSLNFSFLVKVKYIFKMGWVVTNK